MPIRAFFFDIDGTIVNYKLGTVSDAVVDGLRRLHEAGIATFLISGRPPFAVAPLAERLSAAGYVAYNGGLVVKDEKVLFNRPMEDDVMTSLVEFAAASSHPLVFPGIDGYYATHVDDSFTQIFRKSPILQPSYWTEHPVYQVELIAPRAAVGAYVERFSAALHFYPWYLQSIATNVNPIANSKATAMLHALEALGMDAASAVAIGDGPNDVEMIEAAGIGIAMGNACDSAKAVANRVVADVAQDGAAEAIAWVLSGRP